MVRMLAVLLSLSAAGLAQDPLPSHLIGLGAASPAERFDAARRIAARGAAVVPELLAAGRDPKYRAGVLAALHALGADAEGPLLAATVSEDPATRELAVAGLGVLPGDPAERLGPLLAAARADGTRLTALHALASVAYRPVEKPPKAMRDGLKSLVREQIGSENPRVRDGVLRIVIAWGPLLRHSKIARALGRLESTDLASRLAPPAYAGRGPTSPVAKQVPKAPGDVAKCVERGLAFLRTSQDELGRWHPPEMAQVVGVTALGLLALIAHGEADSDPARAAVRYLLRAEQKNGCLGAPMSRDYLYGHAIATGALAAYTIHTGDPSCRPTLERAVGFIGRVRAPWAENPKRQLAWGYGAPVKNSNTSITFWMVRALWLAWAAGLPFDEQHGQVALRWLDRMTDPEFAQIGYHQKGGSPVRYVEMHGQTADKFPAEQSQSMTAAGLRIRLMLGAPPDDEFIRKGIDLCRERQPEWNPARGSIDMYYWHHGSYAMRHVPEVAHGDPWHMELWTAARAGQREDGAWPPIGAWGEMGGENYATAMMLLSLAAVVDPTPLY